MSNKERPLSPHLQVYRLPFAAILSILHRMTGAALAVGALLLTWWLLAALTGVGAFAAFDAFRSSYIGKFMLFGWLFSFVYHFLNGIRHLKWDLGYGVEIKSVNRSGAVAVAGTAILTLLLWFSGGR